jgi:hypothetical protein
VAQNPQQCFLQRFLGFVFLAARDDEQKTIEAVEIKRVKFTESRLIRPGEAASCATCVEASSGMVGAVAAGRSVRKEFWARASKMRLFGYGQAGVGINRAR